MCDNVHPLMIKPFCFAVAHFCRVGNFTFYLVNITLYCFVTVSLKELFSLYFQSIVDFKSYERNDIKGPTNRSVAWKLLLGGQCAERPTVVANTRGTKRLVSINICSVKGNSAEFVSKVSPGIFVIKVK